MNAKAAYETRQLVQRFVETSYPHMLQPFFVATIGKVTARTIGYAVQLKMVGETTTASADSLCATPGYVPAVNDRVLCVWAEAGQYSAAYVLWKIG